MVKGLTTDDLIRSIEVEEKLHPYNELLWYMGSVYTQSPVGLDGAAKAAEALGAKLARRKVIFYSPIAHWHTISILASMPQTDHDLWMAIDNRMIDRCDGMIFPLMTNWEKSQGLAYEAARFTEQGKPVLYWDYKSSPEA